MASNRSNSSKVKSEGNVKNRAISLSFELILQILRKGNYFLVTIQIFLQENARFLHFWLIFDNFGQIQTHRPCQFLTGPVFFRNAERVILPHRH